MKRALFGFIIVLALFSAVILNACGDDDDSDSDSDSPDDDTASPDDDANDDADDDDDIATPESILAKYSAMADAVAASMNDEQYFHDDTWHMHYGDGFMYGPSYDMAAATRTGDEFHAQRGIAALDTNMFMVEAASESLGGLIEAFGQVENLSMALLGLLETAPYLQVPEYTQSAANLIRLVDILSKLMGDYLPPELGEFAGMTYGPTAISSMIALLQMGLVIADPAGDVQAHLDRTAEILERIHETAWSDEAGIYRFAPDDDRLMLYPNATMMLAYGRALELTGNSQYAHRISDIYEGIQPLRAVSGDHFYSPYSREEAGAEDVDYATLSSQNYLMIGLWLAWANTGEQRYLDDVDRILGWIESHLFVDGLLKHHWVNGRVADERDLYDFCSGCNLQTLYIMQIIALDAAAL